MHLTIELSVQQLLIRGRGTYHVRQMGHRDLVCVFFLHIVFL